MKFIKRKLKQFINWAVREEYPQDSPEPSYYVTSNNTKIGSIGGHRQPRDISDMNHGLHLTLYNAVGGKIIQFHSYDVALDKSRSKLYIVNDKEDLGSELGQILTVENLSR